MTNEPPPITPDQFIMLLERLRVGGFCVMRHHQGQQLYMLSIDGIQEATDILRGRPEAAK